MSAGGEIQVVIDTREKRPWRYPGSVRGFLETGDYSVVGYESRVTIERKSKADAYQSIGPGRKRFEAEFRRLAVMDYAAVVIESSIPDFLVPLENCYIHPNAALQTYLGWSVKYSVPVYFAGDRRYASALANHLLRHWVAYNKNKRHWSGAARGVQIRSSRQTTTRAKSPTPHTKKGAVKLSTRKGLSTCPP